MGRGGLKQLQAKRADRALTQGVHGGPGLAPWRGLQSAPLRKNILYFAS